MASSLDTLCGQAFGAGRHQLLGVYKQRAMAVLTLASVPVSVVWAYAGEILVLLRQDPEIAAGAGRYARCMIPALFAYALLECHLRFLQAQNVVVPAMLSSAAAAAAHVAVCWLLVFRLGLGASGAVLGTAVSNLFNLCVLTLYVRLAPACKATWEGFSGEAAFRGIPGFLKLAVPSALMLW
jgi:multidrug resistance protein, MATE family